MEVSEEPPDGPAEIQGDQEDRIGFPQFFLGHAVTRVGQGRKINSQGRVPLLELEDKAAETQNFPDRDGVDPEGTFSGLDLGKLQAEPFAYIEALLAPEFHPQEIDGRISEKGQREQE